MAVASLVQWDGMDGAGKAGRASDCAVDLEEEVWASERNCCNSYFDLASCVTPYWAAVFSSIPSLALPALSALLTKGQVKGVGFPGQRGAPDVGT